MFVRRFFYAFFFVIIFTTAAQAQPGIGASGPLLAKYPDLVALSLDISDSGDLVVVLINRGVPVTTPFVAELHVDGHTRRTLSFVAAGSASRSAPGRGDASLNLTLPLQKNEKRTLVIKNLDVGVCSGNHSLKLVVDPAAAVREVHENNNETSRSLAAPCPDLAVASIKKNYNSARTQYVGEVIVVNQGTGTTPYFSITSVGTAGGLPTSPGGGPTPYPPLAPGKTIKFTVGVANSFESLTVDVRCDIDNVVTESNKDNNVSKKVLMP